MGEAVAGVKVVDSEVDDADIEEFVKSLKELGAKAEVIELFVTANRKGARRR